MNDPDSDAYSVRTFASKGIPLLLACSFSKNFGLYGERTGVLHVHATHVALCFHVSFVRHSRRVSGIYTTCLGGWGERLGMFGNVV